MDDPLPGEIGADVVEGRLVRRLSSRDDKEVEVRLQIVASGSSDSTCNNRRVEDVEKVKVGLQVLDSCLGNYPSTYRHLVEENLQVL